MSVKRSLFVSAVTAALIGGLGVGPALAGEVTGNGKDTQGPAHARSICAFSGLNDENNAEEPTRVQNYGTFKNLWGKTELPSPGDACNPTKGFEE